jgi:hypothetical protein
LGAPNPAAARGGSPCGFIGPSATVSESELREAVRLAAKAERELWFDADGAIDETVDKQFGHLLRYWLASKAEILPSILTHAQTKAIDPSIDYGSLLNEIVSDADVNSVLTFLLDGAPGVGSPPDPLLRTVVEDALREANRSGQGDENFPWSGVFVVSCIRGTAIKLGLETISGGAHVGRDVLLLATEGHRFYVQESYKRRFGSSPRDGTYHPFCPAHAICEAHASCPEERPLQVGDIIVQDRTQTVADIANVDDFCDIPTNDFLDENPLHGDIVVEVTSSDIETIGGNLKSGIDSSTPLVFSVRRRRYPLNPDGTLVVAQRKLFTQEDDTGNLPLFPLDDTTSSVNSKSTGRIFAVLSPVEHCATL